MVIGGKYTHRRINYANNLYMLRPSRKEFRYHKIYICYRNYSRGATRCVRARAHVCTHSLSFPLKNCCACVLIVCRRYASLLCFFFFSSILSLSPFPSPFLTILTDRSRRGGEGLLGIDDSIARETTPLVFYLKCPTQSSTPELKNSWMK